MITELYESSQVRTSRMLPTRNSTVPAYNQTNGQWEWDADSTALGGRVWSVNRTRLSMLVRRILPSSYLPVEEKAGNRLDHKNTIRITPTTDGQQTSKTVQSEDKRFGTLQLTWFIWKVTAPTQRASLTQRQKRCPFSGEPKRHFLGITGNVMVIDKPSDWLDLPSY